MNPAQRLRARAEATAVLEGHAVHLDCPSGAFGEVTRRRGGMFFCHACDKRVSGLDVVERASAHSLARDLLEALDHAEGQTAVNVAVSILERVEVALLHRYPGFKGGQHVGPGPEFAGVPPTVLLALRRELRAGLGIEPPEPARPDVSGLPEPTAEELQAAREQTPICAIKMYRNRTGCFLKEAKEVIDRARR